MEYMPPPAGVWDKAGYERVALGTPERPVTRMVVVGDSLWCSTGHQIKVGWWCGYISQLGNIYSSVEYPRVS